MHVQCPSCGCMNEATVKNEPETVPVGNKLHGTDEIRVPCVVPVWTCSACKESWTDSNADDLRDAATAEAMSKVNAQLRERDGQAGRWTTSKPTEPGWYWWRMSESATDWTCVLEVYRLEDDGELYVDGVKNLTEGGDHQLLTATSGEWSDKPLPEPR